MRKEDFYHQLIAASSATLRIGQQYVSNHLNHDLAYVVVLNQSYDAERKNDEIVYPEDNGKVHCHLSQLEVVDLLHRDNRCPMWIDISVAGADEKVTLLILLCCGRYHADESRLYYNWQGTQPFGIKSPNLPFDWKEGTKFELKKPSVAIEDIVTRYNQSC